MNDAYHYFSATLPHLEFDTRPPMTNEDYAEDCRRLLTTEDFDIFEKCLQREEVDSPNMVVNELARYNRDFLNELVWFRTQRAHKESGEAARLARAGTDSVMEVIQQASKENNLLEAERLLDQARWEQWGNFLMGKISGLEYIVVYGLKLNILNRYSEINSSKGREIFEEIKNMEIPV